VLLSGLRRLLLIFIAIFAITAVVSIVLGALDHVSLERALAVGFYAVGAAVLLGSFVFGLRGPVRGDWRDDKDVEIPASVPPEAVPRGGLLMGGIMPRSVRRTTADERKEARLNSIALFVLGIVLILIGAGFDPARKPF
jgi:hypothetical protein